MKDVRHAMSPKRRAKFLVGGAAVALLVPALIVWGLGRPGAASFYLTVTEAVSDNSGMQDREVRVNGTVVPGSIESRGLQTDFVISDGRHDLEVTTREPLPDTFKDGSEVVVRGEVGGRPFSATEVLAKCPSKFKARS